MPMASWEFNRRSGSPFRRVLVVLGTLGVLGAPRAGAQEPTPPPQPAVITGTVTNPENAPIGSASIVIDQLGVGVNSRPDGTYQLTVPAARITGDSVTLTARFIGYKNRSVRVLLQPGELRRDFVLDPNPFQLGELVVTGAGTLTAAEKLGNVRSQVDSSELLRSNEPNVVQALAGKAPSVVVTEQSGEPGASSNIQIRGKTTINGFGQPLFVVDGVPMSNYTFSTSNFNPNDFENSLSGTVTPNRIADLNPDDISSIEILKGPSAGAIYGARAGQGVVLVTTKRGQPGQTRYSLKTTFSVDEVTADVPLQRRWGLGSAGTPGVGIRSWGPALASGTATYDHWGELFDPGNSTDNTLTISGGNDRTQFYLSGGYLYQDGYIRGGHDTYERISARLNASQRVFENLFVGGNFSYSEADGRFVQKGSNVGGLLLGGLRTPPDFNNLPYLDPATNQQRSYRFPNPQPGDEQQPRGFDNPFFVINELPSTNSVNRAFGNVNAQYSATSWLRFTWTLGADFSSDDRFEGLPYSASTFPTGRIINGTIRQRQVDHNLTGTATWSRSRDLAGSVTVGQNLNARNYSATAVVGRNLIAEAPFTLGNTTDQDPPVDADTVVHNESYFAQTTFDLYEQLYLTAALRNDGSSTFGANNRRSWFPKASAAWVFTGRSSAPRRFGPVSYGKARLAYGQAGTEPAAYQILTTFPSGPIFDGGWGPSVGSVQNGQGGLTSSLTKGQENLKPERNIEWEGGVDLGLFNDHVDLSATYYNTLSKDVILLTPLAPSSGYFQQAANSARIRNEGWELAMNVRPIDRTDFGWDIGVQWARNRNKVLSLAGATFIPFNAYSFTGAVGVAQEGYPVGAIQGNDFVRCGRGLTLDDGTDVDAACGGAPSGALYIGADGYPIGDPTLRIIGVPQPEWTGALRTSIRFRQLQVSGLLDVRHGGQIWNGTKGALYSYGTHRDTEVRDQLRVIGVDWMQEDAPQGIAGPGAGQAVPLDETFFRGVGGSFAGPSSQDIEDGGFVKLREITVQYTMINDPVSRLLGLTSIDLRVAGRNLATWTDYTGIDPETNLSGAEGQVTGIDFFNNPQSRSFVFSIGLNR